MFTSEKVKELNSQRLNDQNIHASLRNKCNQLIEIARSKGYTLLVTQGYRSVTEQDALYAQGRTKSGKIVTNARGGKSNHNNGTAVDFAFIINEQVSWEENLYKLLGAWAKQAGLKWGGDFKTINDKPHVKL